jgi:hypothetical protein
MNSTIGIEYAYTRIHKLELEALAYKDKIAELEAIIQGRDELINNAVSSHTAELQQELLKKHSKVHEALRLRDLANERIAELKEEVQQLTNQLIAMHKGDNV